MHTHLAGVLELAAPPPVLLAGGVQHDDHVFRVHGEVLLLVRGVTVQVYHAEAVGAQRDGLQRAGLEGVGEAVAQVGGPVAADQRLNQQQQQVGNENLVTYRNVVEEQGVMEPVHLLLGVVLDGDVLGHAVVRDGQHVLQEVGVGRPADQERAVRLAPQNGVGLLPGEHGEVPRVLLDGRVVVRRAQVVQHRPGN